MARISILVLGALMGVTRASVPLPEGSTNQMPAGFQAVVVSHTHSDFAWADSIAGCLDKNVAAVAKSVELAERYPDFRFCMEHMLAVREFLHRNPDKLNTVRRLMQEGRFEAGGFFTGPWELTSGGEALVRQLYFGKLWVKKTLGAEPVTVWNVDVAGHTAQLPQILHKAGIKGLVISSGSAGPNLLNWQARDGSAVRTWRTPWWYSASDALGLRDAGLARTLSTMPRFLGDVARNASEYGLPKVAFIADGSDIQSPSENVVQNIRRWNDEGHYPPMKHVSTADAFALVENAPVPTASGEMPSPWDTVQSQGNECFMLDRHLDGRVLAAEKLAAFLSVVDPSFSYPRGALEQVWWNRLYTFDHNWGGTQGEESDRIKTEKIETAAYLTGVVLGRTLEALRAQIEFKKPDPAAVPIVVFNPLSWARSDVVSCELPGGMSDGAEVSIVGGEGTLPCQLEAVTGSGGRAKVVFRAEVPALGYATYYAVRKEKAAVAASPWVVNTTDNTFENRFYRLRIDSATGAIRSWVDKRDGHELARPSSAYGLNELVAFEDTDEDIGLRLTGKRWLAREHPSTIKVVENGPVRLVVEISGQLLEGSRRRQQVILYPDLARIDLVTTIDWDGQHNIQLYQEFPFNLDAPAVRYAVPFGWEQFGNEMPYSAPWFSHDIRPVSEHRWRGVRGWVELSHDTDSVVLASDCNYAALKDLAHHPESGFLIQPLLLRTVHSCGGSHFFYEQKGQHQFRFALQAKGDPSHLGEELDSPLLAKAAERSEQAGAAKGHLPEHLSFLTLSNPNVHVVAVKKAEDGPGVIVRLVEMRERAGTTAAELRFFGCVRKAASCNIIEEGGKQLAAEDRTVRVALAPAGIETLRIEF